MIRLSVVLIFCLVSVFSQAQVLLSEELSNDIKSSCTICKLDSKYYSKHINNDFHLAHYYFSRDKIDSSFIYVSRLLNRKDELTTKELYVTHFMNGLILKDKNLHEASCQSFKNALSEIENLESIESINTIYTNLSESFFNQEKYQEAIDILENWKNQDEIDQKSSIAAKNLHNLGKSYMVLGNYQEAEINLTQSHRLNLNFNDPVSLAYSSMDLANLYYEQYKDSLAIIFFEESLAYAKDGNDPEILEVAYLNMSIIEENKEDYKKALYFNKESQKVKDSIWNRDKIWELAQTDKAIAAATNKERLSVERSKAKKLLIIAGLLLFLLALVSYFVFKINKQRKLISSQKDDLEDLNRLKDDLFAILGHDLRAPMHHLLSINGQMVRASEQVKDTPLFDLIGKNSLASGKMYLILDNLLHWILVKSKKGYFEQEEINLARLVQMVKFNFEALLDHKSINFSSQIENHLTVYADANSLKVVLRNVLDNAIKFTPVDGCISIEGKEDEGIVTLVVKDNGEGMDVRKVNKITKPSLDQNSNKRQSTGLGLKLCQSFLERNNGHFRIESEVGKGTSVIISIPSK